MVLRGFRGILGLTALVWVFGMGGCGLPAGSFLSPPNSLVQALWVWSGSGAMDGPADRRVLVERSAASGVNALYVDLYRGTPNASGRRMYEDAEIADLITRAHARGIEVWAAYGAPDWPALGCDPSAFPLRRMADVIGYNRDNPAAPLDGVMLDVEPPEPLSAGDYQALLALYECLRDALMAEGIAMGVAIRFFWDDPVEYPAGSGRVKPAYQHILDAVSGPVVVMGYRDFAGTACPDDGLICLDQDEIDYASRVGGAVLVGLETANCAPGCGPEKVTFFEEGQGALNREAAKVVAHFRGEPGFAGFAVHAYRDAYLSGLPGWPSTNPGFSRGR